MRKLNLVLLVLISCSFVSVSFAQNNTSPNTANYSKSSNATSGKAASCYWENPRSMLSKMAQDIIDQIKTYKDDGKLTTAEVNHIVQTYIVPRLDIYTMTRTVVPRGVWAKTNSKERKAFEVQFITWMTGIYQGAFQNYGDQKVRIFPDRGQWARHHTDEWRAQNKDYVDYYKDKTEDVSSAIVSDSGRRIGVSYQLRCTDNEWKISSIQVAGVSILLSAQSQIRGLLKRKNNSLPAVTEYLKKHNELTSGKS